MEIPAYKLSVLVAAFSLLAAVPTAFAQQTPSLQIKSFSVGPDQTVTYPDSPSGPNQLAGFADEHTTFFPPVASGAPYLVFGAAATSAGASGIWGAVVLQTTDLKTFTFAPGYNFPVLTSPVPYIECNPAYDTTWDENYATPGSVLQDPTLPAGNLIMLIDAEQHCPGGVWQHPFYISVGFARSSDNGKTWPAPESGALGRHPILQGPDPQPTVPHADLGDGIPAGFVDKSASGDYYLYVAYTVFPSSGSRVARAKLGADPLTFLKWYNGSFSQPGIGGMDSTVTPSIGCTYPENPEISYNDDLGLYLMILKCIGGPAASEVGGLYYSTATSLDLEDWTMPQLIQNSQYPWASCTTGSGQAFDGHYPSTISPGAAAGHTKLTGYIFLSYITCDLATRQFLSRTFTITTEQSSTITFAPLSNVVLGVAPFTITATASSGLTVSFSSNTPAVCTVAGNTVTLVAAGTCAITASQAGNANFLAATPVTRSFLVNSTTGAPQTITFGPLSTVPFGKGPFAINATASSGLTVSFASTTPGVCTVSGSTVTIVAAGVCSITASQPGSSIYVAANPVTQTFTVSAPPPPLQLITVAPCRIMDTRTPAAGGTFPANSTFGSPYVAAGTVRAIPIPSSACSVPASAMAYSLNFTVVPRTGKVGSLTVWPAGETQPNVSTLTSPDGSVLAAAAIVPAGTAGSIDASSTDDTDLVVDINGYFVPPATGTLQFYPLPPCRVLDTRLISNGGSFPPNSTFGSPSLDGVHGRAYPIPSGSCGAPASAAAYSLNVTAVPQGALGFVTAWPTGQTQPFVSTMNSYDGTVLANAAIVPAGTAGAVSFFASNPTDLAVDINGYFAPAGSGGLNFYAVPPCRLVDTRNANGTLGGPSLSAGTTRNFPLPQASCGLPAPPAPPAEQAYSLSMTVFPQGGPLGYLSIWPTGGTQPFVSTLNAYKGLAVANAALVPAGTGGSISVFVTNTTDLTIDTAGYFGP